MNGEVDDAGRALIVLDVRRSAATNSTRLTAWIDTAFTGDLVIPKSTIEGLALPQSAAVMAGLADGPQVVLETYSCLLEWFGQGRVVEVVENEGQFALLGIGLLRDRKLEVDYRSKKLSIA